MTQPASVESNGTVRVQFVTTFVDMLHPKLTELNAVSSLDLSCYLAGDGLTTDTTQNSIEDRRLCNKQTFERPGSLSRALELQYVYNPESPADDEARITLAEGVKGFIVIRWAVDADQAFAVDDILDIYPVVMGAQRKQTPGENSVHKITQKPFVTGAMAEDVLAVA
jgi:hypothetical protein